MLRHFLHRPNLRILVLLALGVLFSGCISTSSEPEIASTRVVDEPPPTRAPAAEVAQAEQAAPPAAFDASVGAALYETSCAPCHGETGGGDGGAAAGFDCPMPAFIEGDAEMTLREWYDITFGGLRTSENCLMPPWSNQLSPDEIWQTVAYSASLRYDESLAPQGETILASAQTAEDVSYLRDTDWQAGITDADILAALADNSLEGYDLPDLSDNEQQAALVYIRALPFEAPPASDAGSAAQSDPVATEDAQNATDDPAPPDDPVATEDASAPPAGAPPQGFNLDEAVSTPEGPTFTLTGTVTNGTEGADVPDDLIVTARVAALNQQGQPGEVYREQVTINADGSYTFEGLPLRDDALGVVQAEHAGLLQLGPQFFLDEVEGDTFTMDLIIYETTDDPSTISVGYTEYLVDAVVSENAALVYQTWEFLNESDRIYTGDENGQTITVTYPPNATGLEVNSFGDPTERFTRVEQDDGSIVYVDNAPVFPGFNDRIVTTFGTGYDGEFSVEQTFPYDVEMARVFVSQPRGLRAESDQLEAAEPGDFNGVTYEGYRLTNTPLAAGETLSYRVYRDPEAAAAAQATNVTGSNDANESGNFLEDNAMLIIGLGGLLVLAGAVFLWYDLQKSRLKTATAGSAGGNQDGVLSAIARLDERYEAGEIDDATYQERRAALKEALRDDLRQ